MTDYWRESGLEDYEKYEKQVTDCWLKSVMEKCSKLGVHVNFGDTPVELPRAGDLERK